MWLVNRSKASLKNVQHAVIWMGCRFRAKILEPVKVQIRNLVSIQFVN